MKHRKLAALSILLIVSLLLVACGGGEEPTEVPAEATAPPAAVEPAATEPGAAVGPAPTAQVSASTLAAVRARGKLICGVSQSVPGFGALQADGSYTGFDIDACKAVAAAVLGDGNAVEYRPLTAPDRFPALASGDIDLLSRNTTWTMSRDTSLGFDFTVITFYDGQGIMVRKADNINTLEDLEGANICVQTGTTTELNLADQMAALGISYTPIVFQNTVDTTEAYDQGQCDAFTTDKSGLVSQFELLTDYTQHVILDATLSKEPLGPLVRHGDNQWKDIVTWTLFGLIEAEELGITSANIGDFMGSEDPVIRRLLGVEGDLGAGTGLDNDFMVDVITQVGNYGEIFDRNLAVDPFNLSRGINDLWTNGGLLYSPPFR